MIGKMLAYERQPPTDPGFYAHPIMAGGWQTERWLYRLDTGYHLFDIARIHRQIPVQLQRSLIRGDA